MTRSASAPSHPGHRLPQPDSGNRPGRKIDTIVPRYCQSEGVFITPLEFTCRVLDCVRVIRYSLVTSTVALLCHPRCYGLRPCRRPIIAGLISHRCWMLVPAVKHCGRLPRLPFRLSHVVSKSPLTSIARLPPGVAGPACRSACNRQRQPSAVSPLSRGRETTLRRHISRQPSSHRSSAVGVFRRDVSDDGRHRCRLGDDQPSCSAVVVQPPTSSRQPPAVSPLSVVETTHRRRQPSAVSRQSRQSPAVTTSTVRAVLFTCETRRAASSHAAVSVCPLVVEWAGARFTPEWAHVAVCRHIRRQLPFSPCFLVSWSRRLALRPAANGAHYRLGFKHGFLNGSVRGPSCAGSCAGTVTAVMDKVITR